MTKYNLYSGNRTGDFQYVGYMTFDSDGLTDMEILPPSLYLIILSYVDLAKQMASTDDIKIENPNDIFMGRLNDVTFIKDSEDKRGAEA